jgi:tetratricopeptide (TPR) repeat protein
VYRASYHARRLAGVLSLLLFLYGCSHTQPRQPLPVEISQRVELTDTPFYAQQRYQCGPASLAMVLGQRGERVSPDELVARVYLPERQGSVAPEVVATARAYGMVVYQLPPNLNALLREVAAGNPVLVLQNLGLSWLPKWHYAVVVGYDLESGELILRSGITARHRVSLSLFDRTWQRGKRWGITLLRPGQLPATSAPLNYMKAVYALEQLNQHEEALLAYRSASRHWPGESSLSLAQGNLEYRLGRYREAEQTLRTALEHHPASAALWNNLAYTLAAQGCREAALSAVACAISLAPGEGVYMQSRQELMTMNYRAAESCLPISCPRPQP